MTAPLVPRSRAEVKSLLAALGLRPSKRFGQNFLADGAILDRIIERSGAGAASVVLEVGPGLGTLTERLLAAGADVVAVEIDRGLVRNLRTVLGEAARLMIVEGDVLGSRRRLSDDVVLALRSRMASRGVTSFDVVSNLPYGISSPFVGSLLSDPGPPRRATLLLQSDFADVLRARPSTDAYSALSVWAQTFMTVRSEFDVPGHAFHPSPDVTSTLVRFEPLGRRDVDPIAFGEFVQTLFQGRRKAIATTLRATCGSAERAADVLRRAGVIANVRVESLEPQRIVALFSAANEDGAPG